MNINVALLAQTLLTAARGAARSEWPAVAPFVESEMQKLAHTISDIENLLRRELIDADRARQLFALQQHAAQAVLATVSIGGEPFAAELIAAGVAAVRSRVRTTVGIDLLSSTGPAVPVTQFRAGKDL
jgi:hypothetical protein